MEDKKFQIATVRCGINLNLICNYERLLGVFFMKLVK